MDNKNNIQDFELGPEDNSSAEPKKTADVVPPTPASTPASSDSVIQMGPQTEEKPKTESITPPAAPEPPKAQPTAQSPAQPVAAASAAAVNPTPPAQTAKPAASPYDAVKRKKAVLGCLGAFGAVIIIFLVLSFIFLAQASSTAEVSPIARLLGVNQASFINGLITFIHVIFLLVSLTAFVIAMVGVFKASMAKRDDKESKKAGLKTSISAGIFLAVTLILWLFVFIYLDSKRVDIAPQVTDPIVTDPEETLNLSAPIDIRFDASNLPVERDFQVLSYKWDFGDGNTGTNQIVTHTFESKGRYDVVLTVTKRNKTTGEEVEEQFSEIVTIANQSIDAVFTATPQEGEVPVTVELDASKSTDPDGKITSYEWDFDEDGEFDDAEGVKTKTTFTKVGTYKISLRITSSTGEFAVFDKEIIAQENKLPKAVISVNDSPKDFFINKEYVFKSSDSVSPNGLIEKFDWDFGDGTKPEKTKTVSHTFTKEGTFEVTLTVTDSAGKTNLTKKIITIGSPQGSPQPALRTQPMFSEATSTLEGAVPLTVTFDATASTDSDNNIVEYEWDFDGDGNFTAFGKTTEFVYTQEGTYTATLKITDATGNVGTKQITVKALAQGVKADLKVDKQDGSVPLTVNFNASGSTYQNGKISSYKWDFGDGTAPKLGDATIAHKYTEIGNYIATVTVIGSDNKTATASVNVTVREIALTSCFVSVFKEGPAPLETTFDPACSTGSITGYFWNFGDGSTSTDVKPSHTFTQPGTYNVVLEVSDSDNTISKSTVTISVTEK